MPEQIDSISIKVTLDDSLVLKQLNRIKSIAGNISVKLNTNSFNNQVNNIQNRLNNLLLNPKIGQGIGVTLGQQISNDIAKSITSNNLISNALGEVIGAGIISKSVGSNISKQLSIITKKTPSIITKKTPSIIKDDWMETNLAKENEDITKRFLSTRNNLQYKLNNKPLILPVKQKFESEEVIKYRNKINNILSKPFKIIIVPKSSPKSYVTNITKSNLPKNKAQVGGIKGIEEASVGGLMGGLGKLGVVAGITTAAIYGISRAFKTLSTYTKETIDSAEGIAKLNSVLNSTGNTTGFTSSQLGKMANDISKLTNYTDENITSSQTLLATFSNIKGDIFNGAIKGATDLSSIFGVDLETSTKQIGKLLNDPLANLNSLKKAGISFSDQQKKNIEILINQNKLYEAQKIILDEINSKVGGAAQNSANSFVQVSNLMGEIRERIGQVLVDTMTLGTGFSGIKGWLDKIITKFDEFKKTQEYISIISKLRFSFQYLFIIAETGFKNILTLVRPIIEAIGALIDIVVSAIGVFGKIATALGIDSITDSFKKLNSELGNLPVISSTLKIPGELIQNHKEGFNKLQAAREEYLNNMKKGTVDTLFKDIKTPEGLKKSEDKVTTTLDKAKNKAKELKNTINSAFNVTDISNWWDTFLQSTQDISNKLEEVMIGPERQLIGNRDLFNTGRGDKMFDNSFNNPNQKDVGSIIEETNDEQIEAIDESNMWLGQIAKNVGVFA